MDAQACPDEVQLEACASGRMVPPAVQEHVGQCPHCRRLLSEIEQNNAFLDRMVPVLRDRRSAPSVRPSELSAIPGYHIRGEASHGGQGIVYRAIQLATRRTVALKVPLLGSLATARQRQRFEREIEIIAALRHPHIVTLYGTETLPSGQTILVMEYVEGEPLDAWLAVDTEREEEGQTPRGPARRAQGELLALFVKLCDAVNFAHQQGVIHRDLKPANIMIDRAGEPRILDFGLARASGDDPLTQTRAVTRTGEFMGTLLYAAPEQVQGDPDSIDTRTDVYALGVILYEALTGQPPYPIAGSLAEALRSIIEAPPARPSAHDPRVNDELDTIVLKALAKDKARRYQSARDLALDLERHMAGEPISAKSDSAWYLLRKAVRRNRWPILAGAAGVALVLAFGILMAVQAGRLAHQRNEAERQRAAAEALLSRSNVERGRVLATGGHLIAAEDLLWPELFRAASGVAGSDFANGFVKSPAFWAIRELYSRQPCRLTLAADPREVTQVVFNSEGDRILTFGGDDRLKQWSWPDGELLRSEPIGCQPCSAADFSADGRYFACATQDGRRIVVRCHDGTNQTFPGDASDPARMLACSADGAKWASAGTNGIVELRDTNSGACLYRIEAHRGPVSRLRFAPGGASLVSAGQDDSALRLWDTSTGRLLQSLEARASAWPVLGFHPGGELLAFTGRANEEFAWWETARGRLQSSAVPYAASIRTLCHSPDGGMLVVGGADGTAVLVDVQSEERLGEYSGHSGAIGSMAFNPHGAELATASVDGRIRVWDVPPYRNARLLTGHLDTVMTVKFDVQSGLLASASGDGTVRLWDGWTGESRGAFSAHSGFASAVAFDASGRVLASGGHDGAVKLWDVSTEAPRNAKLGLRYSFDAGVKRVAHLAFSANGRWLAVCGDEPAIHLWDLSGQPRLSRRLSGHTQRVPMAAFSPDGVRLVSGGADRRILQWDLASGRSIAAWHEHRGPVRAVQFSPDGRRIVSSSDDSTVRLWDAATGHLIQDLSGHRGQVFAAGFSADGSLVASADGAGAVKIWDAGSGEALITFEAGGPVFSLAFSPDGGRLALGGPMSEPLKLWDLTHYDVHIAGNLDYQLERADGVNQQSASALHTWAAEVLSRPAPDAL